VFPETPAAGLFSVCANEPDFLTESSDHREVLRRLVDVAGDELRLVTPAEMIANHSIELGGTAYAPGTRPPQLVIILDDLMRIALVDRVVPVAGESSYRPTDLGRQRVREFDRE
jgi:hypothetical protein